MYVARLGLTPVKGMTHTSFAQLDLDAAGPRYDREFCVVEAATGRVLRTVEDDMAMACHAVWKPPVLMISTPIGDVTDEVPAATPAPGLVGYYWDRELALVAVPGPWTELLSRYFGRPVRLCRVRGAARPVWAGPVSLVTSSALAELAHRLGRPVDDGARFRATIVVDTGEDAPFVEDAWVGSRLRIGSAVISIDEHLPRCAVVDRRPGAGGFDARVLAALASDRRFGGEIVFGVAGRVEVPARITVGDEVVLLPAQPKG
ncbi:MOSC domain-containing protein [Phytoactinopolyspora limicola]|uniref:MOSC domain-containing protein n=1 Tax=Phytoactinopolyspora limicola TaxID=2715536 RepID=UPI00140A2AF2|nr:MOSC domain-containing protein [Phytoactinopolyspora limicola]